MKTPLYITINSYTLDVNTIVDYYPCNILGEYDGESVELTVIKFSDGFKGVYFVNYETLFNLIEDAREV